MTISTKHIIFASIMALSLFGCSSNADKPGSEHGLVDDNVTVETNTTTDQNNTGGSDNNGTTGGNNDQNIKDSGTDTNTTTLQTLTLSIITATLNKDHNTTIKAQAAYSDKSSKDITGKVQWLITPPDAARINGHTLTALKDVNVTLQAKYKDKTSSPVTLSIYWEVKGHRLPPEPDPAVNDSTLLGVDVNHNDVRDDVERWIYEKYKDKHPIYIDIAMQIGKASQMILKNNFMDQKTAKKIHSIETSALICESYYKVYAKYFNENPLVHENIGTGHIEDLYFNTKDRKSTYDKYAQLLSGDSYSTPPVDKNMTSYCDFNTSKHDKE